MPSSNAHKWNGSSAKWLTAPQPITIQSNDLIEQRCRPAGTLLIARYYGAPSPEWALQDLLHSEPKGSSLRRRTQCMFLTCIRGWVLLQHCRCFLGWGGGRVIGRRRAVAAMGKPKWSGDWDSSK